MNTVKKTVTVGALTFDIEVKTSEVPAIDSSVLLRRDVHIELHAPEGENADLNTIMISRKEDG